MVSWTGRMVNLENKFVLRLGLWTLKRMKVGVLIDVLLILFLGLLSITWFRGNNLIAGGDFGFSLDWIRVFKLSFTLWDQSTSLGRHGLMAPFLPLAFFCSVLQFLGFSLSTIEKILFYIWFAGGGISMYFLCRVLEMKRGGRLVASLFYMLNPFSLVIIWKVSHGLIQMPYAFAPLFLAIYIRGIKEEKGFIYVFKYCLILWFLTSSAYMNPRSLAMHLIPVAFYLLSILFFDSTKRKFAIKFTFIFLATNFLLNFYWFFPFFRDMTRSISGAHPSVLMSDVEEMKLTSVDLLKAVRMLGYWSLYSGYKGEPYYPYWQYYLSWPINLISWLIPIIVVFGFFQRQVRKKQLFYFFLMVIIFGLWGIKGPLPPLGGIIVWLYQRIPFSMLAARFSFLLYGLPTYLIFSILIGFGFLTIYDFSKKRLGKLVYFPIGTILILLNVVLVFPFWNGEVIKPNGKLFPGERFRIPSYWVEAKEWLNSQKNFFRVLPLPMSKTYNAVFDWGEGYSGNDLIRWLISQPALYANTGESFRVPELIAQEIEKEGNFKEAAKILGYLNVKYMLLREDTKWDFIAGHTWWFSHNKGNVSKFLQNQKNVSLEKEIGPLKFYKIKDDYLQPQVYFPASISLVDGPADGLVDVVEFLRPESREGVVFKKQNSDKEIIPFSQVDEFFIWREPTLSVNQTLEVKEASYDFEAPASGEYSLFVRNDFLTDYYDVSNGKIELKIDNGGKEARQLKSYSSNLITLGKLFLKKGPHKINIFVPKAKSLVGNISSEKSEWHLLEILSNPSSRKSASITLSFDDLTGNRSLNMLSKSNPALIYSPIKQFHPGNTYDIFVGAKHLKGNLPILAIWEDYVKADFPFLNPKMNQFGSSEPTTNFSSMRLENSGSWKKYRFSFKPLATSQAAGLAFIEEPVAIANGVLIEKTENLFSDVRVEKVFNNPLLLKYSMTKKKSDKAILDFQMVNPNKYLINIKNVTQPYVLVLSDSFDPDWKASIKGDHFIVNGFANGWYLSKTGDYQITLEYQNQKNLIFSYGVTLASVAFFLAYFLGKRCQKR